MYLYGNVTILHIPQIMYLIFFLECYLKFLCHRRNFSLIFKLSTEYGNHPTFLSQTSKVYLSTVQPANTLTLYQKKRLLRILFEWFYFSHIKLESTTIKFCIKFYIINKFNKFTVGTWQPFLCAFDTLVLLKLSLLKNLLCSLLVINFLSCNIVIVYVWYGLAKINCERIIP